MFAVFVVDGFAEDGEDGVHEVERENGHLFEEFHRGGVEAEFFLAASEEDDDGVDAEIEGA